MGQTYLEVEAEKVDDNPQCAHILYLLWRFDTVGGDSGLAAVTCVIGTEIETDEGVEGSMLGEDGLTSDIVGVGNIDDSEVSGALLGRRPEVSNELSGSSGIAWDAIDGDARSMEDS